MTGLSAREAAEQVGLTKQAIIKAIRKGTISAVKDESGEWRIEPAELFRVYQAVTIVDGNQPATVDSAGLHREIAFRDDKLALLQEQVDDLRRRLDESETERRQSQERLTALLTDQRPQPAERRRKWWPWG